MDQNTKALFIQLVRDGGIIQELTRLDGLPSIEEVNDARANDPDFRLNLNSALKARGEVFFEKAILVALAANKANATPSKLVIDTFKWAAVASDPERFGGKALLVDHGDGIVILDTGVNDGRVEEGAGPQGSEGERQEINTRGDA